MHDQSNPADWLPACAAAFELRRDLPLLHVLDVGANPLVGAPPYLTLLKAGMVRVTGFEPHPEAHAALEASKGPLETYHRAAVGDGKTATLHVTRLGGFSSLFPPDMAVGRLLGWESDLEVVEKLKLKSVRIDKMDDVADIDFLKIDVQGAETSIIHHARKRLASVVGVQTEVRFLPLYEGEPRFGDLDRELGRLGLELHDFVSFKTGRLFGGRQDRLRRTAKRQLIDGDAIYLRGLVRPESLSDGQLHNLVLASLGIVQSAAPAAAALDELVRRKVIDDAQADSVINALPRHIRLRQ